VHLTGKPADLHAIHEIGAKANIHVIEDAAQAIGAEYRNKKIGTFGIATAFSLHPLKNLGVYGDGGFITTNDLLLAQKIRLLRNHGLKNRDECMLWGYNSRLDSIQAAFASVKLRHLDRWTARNREIANFYNASLRHYVAVPEEGEAEKSAYHNYVIRTSRRSALISHLANDGIEAKIHYPIPIHLQPPAKNDGFKFGDFPNAERLSKEILSLPIYPELTSAQIKRITDSVTSFFAE